MLGKHIFAVEDQMHPLAAGFPPIVTSSSMICSEAYKLRDAKQRAGACTVAHIKERESGWWLVH